MKHIVITGCSRGLGLALTHGFIELGHTISGCARSQEPLKNLENTYSDAHFFSRVDVSDPQAAAVWADQCVLQHGVPDLVINNAAIINPNANLWEIEDLAFSQLIDINIKAVFYVCKSFLRHMVPIDQGVLVNFSSGWGRSVSPQVASYCCSKWAIEGLTQSLATELPNSMAAVPVNPGIIHTRLLNSCFGSEAARFPSPEQWAREAVPFLLALTAADSGKPLSI